MNLITFRIKECVICIL